MPDISLSPTADQCLDDLWNEGSVGLLDRLEDAIDWIRDGDPRARSHRLGGPALPDGAWLIAVPHGDETWAVIWVDADPAARVLGIGRTDVL
jgi:hypothetical protein